MEWKWIFGIRVCAKSLWHRVFKDHWAVGLDILRNVTREADSKRSQMRSRSYLYPFNHQTSCNMWRMVGAQ